MKHNPRNIFFHELIGLRARIIGALNPTLIGLEGVIHYETTRSLILKTPDGRTVRALKHEVILEIQLPSGERVVVPGDHILGDPAERTKRLKWGRR